MITLNIRSDPMTTWECAKQVAVEDEIHFLFDFTWRKYHLHREKFIEDVGKMVTSFNYLNTSQKFLYIVTCEDKEILIKFAIFITLMNKERERALTF